MDPFFDERGRDRIINDWLEKTGQEELAKTYKQLLAVKTKYPDINDLVFMAFEAGIEFAQVIVKRNKSNKNA